jgi:hypothetical protein
MDNQFRQKKYTVTYKCEFDVTASDESEARKEAKALFVSWLEEDAHASDFSVSVGEAEAEEEEEA